MLEKLRKQIARLKEARTLLLSNLITDLETFKNAFPDVYELINQKKQEQNAPAQLVKTNPTSSFVNFQ